MNRNNHVILVVEDIAIIRMEVAAFLVAAGFEALQAENADEAIRILESRPDVHLVFTDISMPGTMDGIKLSHYIRNRWPPLRLIVASGNALVDESDLPQGAQFFPKPYLESAILEAMIGMLAESNSEYSRA